MDSVDAFIYQHIPELVSAVGGTTEDTYALGDEGIGCLADIKKWLLNYDTRSNKWETAHAISQTTLVETDLVNILAAFYRQKVSEKAALMSLEIITHLTWPIELDPALHNKKHESQFDDLQAAQLRYKTAILNEPSHAVFRGAIALAVPGLQKSTRDRTSRENSITNLVVNFVRNVLAIDTSNKSPTIVELSTQKMFDFLILVCSSQDSITPVQAVPIIDVLWNLTNGIDPLKLFGKKSEFTSQDPSLEDILAREKKLKASRFKPTRHSRFGTMVSLDIDGDGNSLAVSGQRALGKDYLGAIDDSKKWRKPKLSNPRRREKIQWQLKSITPEATRNLRDFVSTFIDSSYNPLFMRTKGFVGGFSEGFDQNRIMYYVYTLGWFANAERARHPNKVDFKLVGVALSHAMFTLVCDIVANNLESGPLQSFDTVHAGMATLRVIFTLIDEMTRAADEWKEAAESMLARLFYDEIRLDMFSKLPRVSSKRTETFQSESIELTHCLLRLLDYYASDKSVLFIKSRKKANKDDDDEEMEHTPKLRERKWDVDRYIKKFYNETTIDLYQQALERYQESDYKVLKHTLAFLHRLFIKKELRALFYRLAFLNALVRISSSTSGIVNADLLKGYEKFAAYYAKKLFESAEKSPSIFIELLFHKSRYDVGYYDQGVVQGVSIPKKALEYEYEFIDSTLDQDQKVRVCTAALIEDNHKDIVDWISETTKELIALQEQEQKLRIFTESTAKLKELTTTPIARALLREMGLIFDKGRYFVPASLGSFELIELNESIIKAMSGTDEDPHNFLARSMANQDNDDDLMVDGSSRAVEQESSEDEDGFNDPRLQPLSAEELLAKKREVHRAAAKKISKRRVEIDDSDSEGESETSIQKKPKVAKPVEIKNYKSSAFIHASDDDEDEERDRLFFEQELARQRERNKAFEVGMSQVEPSQDSGEPTGLASDQELEDSDLEKPQAVQVSEQESEQESENEIDEDSDEDSDEDPAPHELMSD